MFLSKAEVRPVAAHTGVIKAFPSEHLLFSVRQSAGRLRMAWFTREKSGPPYEEYHAALLLDGVPLAFLQSTGCPTCESLLAAGYGLPADSRELGQIRQRLDRPYAGLDDALQRLDPIVGLLAPGDYILSYSAYCPTDGDGRFFWDTPQGLTSYPATAELYDSANFRILPAFPCFLFPSQPPGKYDHQQVAHYRSMLQDGAALPPALAYSLWGYMSVLLDGHHRACACALEGRRLPCLTISSPGRIWREGAPHLVWPDGYETPVGEGQTPLIPPAAAGRVEPIPMAHSAGAIRAWPEEYGKAARQYPTCWEAGMLALYPKADLNAEGLRFLAMDDEYEEVSAAARLLAYAARQPGADIKALGMAFVEPGYPEELRRTAFAILDQIKNDPEVDDLMIQVLVYGEKKDDPIYRIADGHWSGE